MTVSVATARRSVRTPVTAPPVMRSPITVVRVANVTPRARAARAYAVTRLWGCR